MTGPVLAQRQQQRGQPRAGVLADQQLVEQDEPGPLRGLPLDAPSTPELKAAQRAWFILLYQLLIGKDTGPRLPTLLLALGQDQIRRLLTPG